jgi:hypothetical protein
VCGQWALLNNFFTFQIVVVEWLRKPCGEKIWRRSHTADECSQRKGSGRNKRNPANIPQGADSASLPLGAAKAGRNHLNKYKNTFLSTGIGKRYSQTISIICLAATFRRRERPYKRNVDLQCNSMGHLYQSLL